MNSEQFKWWLEGFLAGVGPVLSPVHLTQIRDKLSSVSGPSYPYSYPYHYYPLSPVISSSEVGPSPSGSSPDAGSMGPSLNDLNGWVKKFSDDHGDFMRRHGSYYGHFSIPMKEASGD